jgi:hypothetical protein
MTPTVPKPPFPAGSRVRVTQNVRVGDKTWETRVTGTIEDGSVRPVGGMEMGAKAHFSFQPTIRLRLDDGEVTVVAVDPGTTVELLDGPAAGGR